MKIILVLIYFLADGTYNEIHLPTGSLTECFAMGAQEMEGSSPGEATFECRMTFGERKV